MNKTSIFIFLIILSNILNAQKTDVLERKIKDDIFNNLPENPVEQQRFIQKQIDLTKINSVSDSTKALLFHKMGSAFFMDNQKEMGKKYFEEAFQIRIKVLATNHIDIAKTATNLGLVSFDLNENENALNYFFKSASIYKTLKHPNEAYSYNWIATIYKDNGDFKLAEKYIQLALNYAIINKDEITTIDCLNTKGNILLELEQYEKAIVEYTNFIILNKNLIQYDPIASINQGIVYYNLASCFNKLKKNSNAISNAMLAMPYISKSNEKYRLSRLYNEIGLANIRSQNTNIAINNFSKSLNLLKKDNSHEAKLTKSISFLNLAKIQSKEEFLHNAFNEIYKNYPELMKADLNTINRLTSRNIQLHFFNLISDYLYNFKNNQEKLNFLIFGDKLIDLLRNSHTEQGSKLFWREKTHSFYENAIETCFRLKDFKKAFYFMEKSRSILLLDALKDIDASKVLNSEQQNTEQSLRYQTIGLQNKLNAIDEQDKSYPQIFQQLIEAKEKHQTFIKSLEKSNPNYYNLKYNNNYVSLPQIQAELKTSKQAFIQYFVGDSAVYALCIKASGIDLKKIELHKFQNLSFKFLQLLALKPPHTVANLNEIQAVSYQLYQLIFEPFDLSENRLIVSQDNLFIPFESLIFNLKSKQFLLQKYAISYTYSANVLMRKHDKSEKFGFIQNNLLGFAPQKFENFGLTSLIGSDKVLEKIEKEYFLGKIFLNQEATKQNFIQNASNYGIIQLFTHGKSDTISDESKIYFYDKSLSINELYQMNKLNASLVVLSACETNLGQNATGEGVMSFARGFAYLNVPTTVSTLWSVNNQSTYQITEQFYKYLKAGLNKDEALQKAKLDYLKNSGNVYPYYWSGMVLIGETSANRSSYLWFLIAIGTIILGFICWKFRHILKLKYFFKS